MFLSCRHIHREVKSPVFSCGFESCSTPSADISSLKDSAVQVCLGCTSLSHCGESSDWPQLVLVLGLLEFLQARGSTEVLLNFQPTLTELRAWAVHSAGVTVTWWDMGTTTDVAFPCTQHILLEIFHFLH